MGDWRGSSSTPSEGLRSKCAFSGFCFMNTNTRPACAPYLSGGGGRGEQVLA